MEVYTKFDPKKIEGDIRSYLGDVDQASLLDKEKLECKFCSGLHRRSSDPKRGTTRRAPER